MTPRFSHETGAVSLAVMVAHAREIERSDPEFYPDLQRYDEIRRTAARLLAASRLGAPEEDLVTFAHDLDRVLTYVRRQKALPRADKPTVGKATDRLGEKGRRAEKKAQDRAERRTAAKASPIPADSLFGGTP